MSSPEPKPEALRVTPLHALHIALGARMVPFAGYDMPVQYPAGILTEHRHCRSEAGLFDVSHMGQIRLTAKDGRYESAARALQALTPGDFVGLAPMRQRYSVFLNETGGIRDDLMVVNQGDSLFLIVNGNELTLLAGSAVSPQPSVPEQMGAQKNAAEKSPSETKVIDKNGTASAKEQNKAGTAEKKQPEESAGAASKASATNGAKEARKEAPAPQIIVPRPEPDKALKKDVTPQPQPEKAQKKDAPTAPIIAPQPPRNQVKKKEERRVAPARQPRRQAARQPKAPRKDTLPKA